MLSNLLKKVMQSMRGIVSLLVIGGMIAPNLAPVFADEPATISVTSVKNVNIRMYGFVETDFINDSNIPSFYEEPDTTALPKANTYAGNNGRTIMSVRNSRLGFDVSLPETDGGLKSEAILEMDFMGNQAANDTPGTSTATGGTATLTTTTSKGNVTSAKLTSTAASGLTQTERDFFNNPTMRVRHAYLNLTYGDDANDNFNAKVGQTWSLFGWQPYYFPSEPIVAPSVGQLYRRFPQIRATDTRPLEIIGLGDWKLETSGDIAKPAEMDSEITDFHAGVRLSYDKRKAATGFSSGSSMGALSLAASWVWIPVNTANIGNQTGQGYAIDALIPIIPSKDGKDMANNLSLCAEYANGTGIGGLELAGASSGIAALTAVQTGNTAIDSGIAGLNNAGLLELIQYETLRADLTYVLPYPKWAVSTGYAQVKCDNVGDFSTSASSGYVSVYQYYYGSLFYTPLKWLRFGLEYAEFHNAFVYPVAPYAQDNRIQFTTYVTF